ncbi:MAG: 3-hydroxyacyl-CoA dehydrogenase [Candidatus Omnitrophica bacterium]|nr:3-hydroxyacyl-CoA dehydrogenase [Candidatus Omnitrophota bacterium]
MYIYKAGVVGGGTMGAGIAQAISYGGLPVVLKDVSPAAVDKALAAARAIYQGRVDKGKMAPQELEAKMALITGATDLAAFKDVDLVIEAVPERLELKRQAFAELDRVCPPTAILASNTSALSISALGAATHRPEKVIGLHFFFPAHVMKLVEIIPGVVTAQETVEDATAFAEGLRKLPVRVNECPGFLVNRLLMPYLNEAVFCLQEGSATMPEIESAMTALGWPMGPFTLVDALGLDVCAEAGKVLLDGYGERMRPAALWTSLLDAKRFGRKSGAGFYRYAESSDPRAAGTADEALAQMLVQTASGGARASPGTSHEESPLAPATRRFSQERLMFGMVNEAILALQEGISSAADIDLAVVAGLGYPMSDGGILHYADRVGLDVVLAGLERFARELGPRFHPAYRLRQMVAAGLLGVKTKRGFFEYP